MSRNAEVDPRLARLRLDGPATRDLATMSKRDQVTRLIGDLIGRSVFQRGEKMPSCRELGSQLGVSRNTVFSTYIRLVDLGLLEARDRAGYYVRDTRRSPQEDGLRVSAGRGDAPSGPDTAAAIRNPALPTEAERIVHPGDWRDYRYPFIYNQVDPALFPIENWRECSRIVHGRRHLPAWSTDRPEQDSPELIHQVQQRLFKHRGITVEEDEILVTLGSQNALAILATLLNADDRPIAMEDPGFQEARHVFRLYGNRLLPVPVDERGLVPDKLETAPKAVYVTPGHHFPTMVTMTPERREELLSVAARHSALVIEDDYEMELTNTDRFVPAVKAWDQAHRVIYIGSLSKTISPSMRIGFMVAHRDIIREARLVRSLTVRQVPSLMQETAALFMALGYYDAQLRLLRRRYSDRHEEICKAAGEHLPGFRRLPTVGGTCIWLEGPKGFDSDRLAIEAQAADILIDRSSVFFMDGTRRPGFRLGYSVIGRDLISAGVRELARVAGDQM